MFRSPGKVLLTLTLVLLATAQLGWVLLKDTEVGDQWFGKQGIGKQGVAKAERIASDLTQSDLTQSDNGTDQFKPVTKSDSAADGDTADRDTADRDTTDGDTSQRDRVLDRERAAISTVPDGGLEETLAIRTSGEQSRIDPLELTRRIAACSVRVNAWPDGEGCGVIVAVTEKSFDVLTAAHVLTGSSHIEVDRFSEAGSVRTERSVAIVRSDTDRDLALLRVQTPILPDQRTAVAVVRQVDSSVAGMIVWVVQCSATDGPEVRSTKVDRQRRVARTRQAKAIDYFVLPAASTPGMSGGGLFDGRGQLVGIASGNGDGKAHYVSPSEITRFLNQD